MACFVYILRCSDGTYYTGTARDTSMDRRLSEHNNGHYPKAYTARRRPVQLMFSQEFANITDAIAAE